MANVQQPESPNIELIEENGGEITLAINGRQAMQGWERDLMWESADLLCRHGSQFLEVGLGLGISALRIATNAGTRRHVVVEKYQRVIDLFRERYPVPPPALEIVHSDFVDYVRTLEPESLDGIFFDPYLPPPLDADPELFAEVVPLLVNALRPGGVLIPFFTTKPLLRFQFYPYFSRIVVERRTFQAYPTTEYTPGATGDAFIQCFIKT